MDGKELLQKVLKDARSLSDGELREAQERWPVYLLGSCQECRELEDYAWFYGVSLEDWKKAVEAVCREAARRTRESEEEERLWVVEWVPGNSSVLPEPRFWPDWEDEGIEVVWADAFGVIVSDTYADLETVVRHFPYLRISGHPADGRWVWEGGDEVYIYDGVVLEDWQQWVEAAGWKPKEFCGEMWDDVDPDTVISYIPSF